MRTCVLAFVRASVGVLLYVVYGVCVCVCVCVHVCACACVHEFVCCMFACGNMLGGCVFMFLFIKQFPSRLGRK